MIEWIFDLIGKLWNGFWNVSGKLFSLALFAVACGAAAVACLRLHDAASTEAWLYFKGGAALGLLLGGIRLLIREVAVPLLWEQEKRERDRRRRELDTVAERIKTTDRDWSTRRF